MYRLFLLFGILGLLNACNEVSSVPKDNPHISNITPVNKASYAVKWHWEDEFDTDEKDMITMWLGEINQAVNTTFGAYPFEMHFFIHRSKKGNEPVPWAHTTRGKVQGVHFHVNTQFSKEEFLKDWTAQHEISHLSIPYVGKNNSWFSEGYATYMQYQVMHTQGVYNAVEVEKKYLSRVAACKESYQSNLPLPQVADSLKSVWNYPDLYWGGVSFFWELDKRYQENIGLPLNEVIKMYVACCRSNHSDLATFCKSLDEVTETKTASQLLVKYQTQPAYLIFENM